MTDTPSPAAKLPLGYFSVLVCWILFFGLGALIDTTPSRIAISPISTLNLIEDQTLVNASLIFKSTINTTDRDEPEINNLRKRFIEWSNEMKPDKWLLHFITCLLCFTPINIATLAIFSGVLSGYYFDYSFNKKKDENKKTFLSRPIIGATRGFLVFASLFTLMNIVVDDPIGSMTQSRYTRLAVSFSVISFAITYYSFLKDDKSI